MQLNQKESLMLRHYSKLLDEFLFDEYDILGFLMLIRERIRKEKTYPCILGNTILFDFKTLKSL